MKLKWAVPLVFLMVLVLRLVGVAQNYAPATNYPTSAAPQGLAQGDFNEDGKPDIAVTDFNTSSIQIFPGNGDGTFGAATATSTASHPYSVAAADLNGDGHLDLVVSLLTSQGFEILFGSGNSQFQSPTIYTVSGLPTTSTVGQAALKDVNGDGKIDVVLATDRGIALFINNGSGGFTQQPSMVDSANVIANVSVLDLDGDGVPDLVATESTFDINGNATGTVIYALGHGDGTFSAVTNIANLSGPPTGLVVADVDHDGLLDVVVSFASSTIGTGGGTTVTGCPTPRICLPQDGGGGTTIPVPGGIGLIRQTAKLQFATANSIGTDHNPGFLVAGDFDGDGRLDVAEASTAQPTILVFHGNADGTFATPQSLAIPSVAAEIAIGSFTQTNALDVFSSDRASNQVSVFVNQGANMLSLVSSANPSAVSQSITLTATVQPKFPIAGTLSGSVIFADGGTTLGTAAVDSAGVSSFTTPFTTVGDHALTAVYGGNSSFDGGSSAKLVQHVVTAPGVTLISSLNPSGAGQPVNFTVTVAASGSSTPTGTVTLLASGSPVLSATVDASGHAVLTTSSLSVGSNNLVAQYSGDSNYPGAESSPLAQVVNKSNPTATLTSSANPSAFGQPVNLTITVTAPFSGGHTPTGNVSVKDAGTVIATSTLDSSGAAMITLSNLSVGTHSLSVDYAGDTNFNGSTSAVLSLVVNKSNPTTTLTSSANPSAFGQPMNLTITVTAPFNGGHTPTGSVSVKDAGTGIATSTLDSTGAAVITLSNLSAGTHSLSVDYAGDANFNTSTSAVLSQVVSMSATSSSLSSSPNPSNLGQDVTLSAVVKGSAGAGTPSGVVVFDDGTNVLGSANLDATGTAVLTLTSLAIGSHTLTASYAGNGAFHGSTSAALTQVVNQNSVKIVFRSSANPAVFGETISLSAVISAASPGASKIPTGSISFLDGATVLGQAAIDATGNAVFATGILSAGTHSLTANYAGDSSFSGGSASLSQVINKAVTGITLTSSLDPATNASSILLHAAATSGAGTPSGTVQFFDGAVQIGSSILDSAGSASLNVSNLSVGTHALTASYTGSANLAASASLAINESVVDSHSQVLLVSSTNPQSQSQPVIFTATVIPALSSQQVSGTIVFRDGTQILATLPVTNGGASFSTIQLAAGTHVITAAYQASTTVASPFDGSSAPVTEVIQASAKPDYTVSIQPAAVSVVQGSTLTTSVTVAPVNGFAGPVTLGCSGLPANARCVFQPGQVVLNGQTPEASRLQIVTSARYPISSNQDPEPQRLKQVGNMIGLWLTPGLFGCVLLRERKRVRVAMTSLCLLACMTMLSGCGSSNAQSNQRRAVVYDVSVTATSGNVVHSTILQLTLQ